MTRLYKIFLGLGYIFVMGCGTPKAPSTITDGSGFNPDTLAKVGDEVCGPKQELAQDGSISSARFDRLISVGSVVGFTGSEGDCMIDRNVSEEWTANGTKLWFTMDLNGSCLQSGSLWKVIRVAGSGNNGVYYSLDRLDRPEARMLDIGAERTVQGEFPMRRVGLRAFKCQ